MTKGTEEVEEEALGTIKRHAGLGMALGTGIVIAGVLAVLSPLIAGLSVTIAVGVLLIMSGASRLYLAFKMGSFGAGLLVFVLGLLSLGVGGYLVSRPGIGLSALTLFLAVYFVADGVIEIIWSFRLRPIKGWGWTLFSGIAALVLGIMIWRQFPVSGEWAVGTITGIHMILAGSAIALLSRAARRHAKAAQHS
jgi:uncharacterized membrane protein HdeD (DUF308 family)